MSTSAPPKARPAWLPLGVAALVVPTALAGLTLLWPRPQIEDGLTGAATQALAAAGLDTGTGSVDVSFSGRDATITGLTGPDGQRAIEIVAGVTGVRTAQLAGGGAGGGAGDGGGPGTGPATVAGMVGAALRGDDLVLTGEVGSEEDRAALVAAATDRAATTPSASRTVVDELTVTPGTTLPGGLDAATLGAAAGALAGLVGDDLGLTVETGADGSPTLALTGAVPDDAASAAAQRSMEGAVPDGTVDNRLTVSAPVPLPAPQTGELDDAAKAALQSAIDDLVAGAPIRFRADSPELTPAGRATVDRIVELVAAAPGARLQVDGFVATGPGAGVLSAQELSDARAATVRDALVAGGVPADRVAATGRGEGDRPAARDAGRRAAVGVV